MEERVENAMVPFFMNDTVNVDIFAEHALKSLGFCDYSLPVEC